MKTIRNNNGGFTLVEMLVSIVVFMTFLGALFGSYTAVVGAQKDSSAVREMYSGARALFAQITDDIRLSTIDYYYYTQRGADANTDLALLSKDGLNRVLYEVVSDDELKMIKKTTYFRSDTKCPFTELEVFENITPPTLDIDKFQFLISPTEDPYALSSSDKYESQLQPLVTLLAEFRGADKFTFPLQASVSSRVYTKIDQRDRINFDKDKGDIVSCEF